MAMNTKSTVFGGLDFGILPLPATGDCHWSAAPATRNASFYESGYHLAAMIASFGGVVAEEAAEEKTHSVRTDAMDAHRHALELLQACGHAVFGGKGSEDVLPSAHRSALILLGAARKNAREYIEAKLEAVKELAIKLEDEKDQSQFEARDLAGIFGKRNEEEYGYENLNPCQWIEE